MTIAVNGVRGVVASTARLPDSAKQMHVSRKKSQVRGRLMLALLAAAFCAAHAQNSEPGGPATPTPQTPSAPHPSSASALPRHGKTPQDATARANSAPVVCFKLTMHCLGGSAGPTGQARASGTQPDATADARARASRPGTAPSNIPMNLTPPDIRTVVSPEELKEPLETGEQQAQAEESETVQVKGAPNTPDVPGGFGAIWWALKHPSQAWRIFAPAE